MWGTVKVGHCEWKCWDWGNRGLLCFFIYVLVYLNVFLDSNLSCMCIICSHIGQYYWRGRGGELMQHPNPQKTNCYYLVKWFSLVLRHDMWGRLLSERCRVGVGDPGKCWEMSFTLRVNIKGKRSRLSGAQFWNKGRVKGATGGGGWRGGGSTKGAIQVRSTAVWVYGHQAKHIHGGLPVSHIMILTPT